MTDSLHSTDQPDALDDYWNSQTRGLRPLAIGLDPELRETVRRFLARADADAASAPNPLFLTDLKQRLTMTTPVRVAVNGAEATAVLHPEAPVTKEPTRRRWAHHQPPWWARLQIAAVVALLLAAGSSILERSPSTDQGGRQLAAPSASPVGNGMDCEGPSAPVDELHARIGEVEYVQPDFGFAAPRRFDPPTERPAADAKTVQAISAIVERAVVCFARRDVDRLLALYTARFVQREVVNTAAILMTHGQPRVDAEQALRLATLHLALPSLPGIRSTRLLRDGRVEAIFGDGPGEAAPTGELWTRFVFVEQESAWLIDDVELVWGTGRPETPPVDACTVEPRSLEELERLAASGTPLAAATNPVLDDLPPSRPIDARTLAAIQALVRELAACELARDPLRQLSLISDRYLGDVLARQLQADPSWLEQLIEGLQNESDSVREATIWTFLNAVVLPDGRVVAQLVDRGTTGARVVSPYVAVLLHFVNEHGHWRFAGLAAIGPSIYDVEKEPMPLPTPATPFPDQG